MESVGGGRLDKDRNIDSEVFSLCQLALRHSFDSVLVMSVMLVLMSKQATRARAVMCTQLELSPLTAIAFSALPSWQGYAKLGEQRLCLCGYIRDPNLTLAVGSYAADDQRHLNCSSTIQCGSLSNIAYPFWGMNRASYCGVSQFQLTCQDNTTTLISISGLDYRVLQVDNALRTMTVARSDYWNNLCPTRFHNTSLEITAPFSYTSDTVASNLTIYYGCGVSQLPTPLLVSSQFNCSINNNTVTAYFVTKKVSDISSYANLNHTSIMKYFSACNTSVVLAANQSAVHAIESNPTEQTVQNAIIQGFGLQWDYTIYATCESCVASGGRCGTDASSGNFACYCVDKAYFTTCPGGKSSIGFKWVSQAPVLASGGSAVVGILLFVWIFRCVRGKCWPRRRKNVRWDDVDAMIRSQGSAFPRRYKYRDLKKLTRSFSEKLGEGGYGEVYKGKLPDDGRLVAVKILKDSKGDGEEFINEVASISRTAHVNIVKLLGFCYEGKKRALLYDYMPNGSLDKFLPKSTDQGSPNGLLEWKVFHRIAVGIARGLEYLHQGCNTRILHFDIKPQNILLDHDFTPKISDFGLAKLCQGRDSIVSMLGMRGTIGYIAPEVFSRNFGAVSHKSDVYSYGMLVFEMIGCKDSTGLEASRSSEMYFPEWVYKHLESGKALWMSEINTPEDEEIARKMMLVSLWCIQTNPSDRPSMSKVIEMMKGSIELLRVPPNPFLFSPPEPAGNDGVTTLSSSVQSSSSALLASML